MEYNNHLDTEMYEKALEIVKTQGVKRGIYTIFNDKDIHISHTEWNNYISMFDGVEVVLTHSDNGMIQFKDGEWIGKLNKIFKEMRRTK